MASEDICKTALCYCPKDKLPDHVGPDGKLHPGVFLNQQLFSQAKYLSNCGNLQTKNKSHSPLTRASSTITICGPDYCENPIAETLQDEQLTKLNLGGSKVSHCLWIIRKTRGANRLLYNIAFLSRAHHAENAIYPRVQDYVLREFGDKLLDDNNIPSILRVSLSVIQIVHWQMVMCTDRLLWQR
jgi:hypothetical protein